MVISWNNNLYTKAAFLRIMYNTFPEVIYWRMKGDKIIPPNKIKKADIEGWIAFTGARYLV